MAEITPDELDQWRWGQALKSPEASVQSSRPNAMEAACGVYRRLVREDVQPPAEPDQDTLDTRAVLAVALPTWGSEAESGGLDEMYYFEDAKAALSEIKERVRKEALQALPDDPKSTDPVFQEAYRRVTARRQPNCISSSYTRKQRLVAAIKQVYG